MELSKLPKTTKRSKKRVGRGYGSGKGGHTAGRGAKGLKARGKVPLTFEGTKIKKSFLKKLPLQRGKGKFKPLKAGPMIVNLKYLNIFPKGSEVDLAALVKRGVVREKEARSLGVKILGEGELKTSLRVNLPCSDSAVKKIEKAGGKVVFKKEIKAKTRARSKVSSPKKPSGPKRPKKKEAAKASQPSKSKGRKKPAK